MNMKIQPSTYLLTTASLVAVVLFTGADWLQFRGSNNTAQSASSKPPLEWKDAEAWSAKLPGKGPASPIVIGDTVVTTGSSGVKQNRLHVVASDVKTGEELWSREFWATGRTETHPTSAVAANTPASDGKRIFAFYSSNDLICLDLEGNLLWYRGLAHDYPKVGNDVGMSSSPLVIGDVVIVQIEAQGDSFAAGLNSATGETLWRKERGTSANWSSPTLVPAKGKRPAAALLQSRDQLTLVEPKTGRELWNYDLECSGIPSATTDGEWLYVAANGITAFRFSDDSPSPEFAWDSGRLQPGSASPLYAGDKIYVINRAGVMSCANARTGDDLWKLRLKGSFWASPVMAGKHLFCSNNDGDVLVVLPGADSGEIVATNVTGEGLQATPAISGDAIYVRSDKSLKKFAAP